MRKLAAAGAGLAVAFGAAAPPASAETFTVASANDAVDADIGDGACSSTGGVCTLRAAAQESNAGPGRDTIVLPPGTITLSIAGTFEDAAATGDVDLTEDATVAGHGARRTKVDGAELDRVFEVRPGANVTVAAMTVTNGKAPADASDGLHDVRGGGGILNYGELTVSRTTLTGNTQDLPAGTTVGDWGGGALMNGGALQTGDHQTGYPGTLIIDRSTIANNVSRGFGGGIMNNLGTLTVTNSTVSGNLFDSCGLACGVEGAGIYNRLGEARLVNVTVTRNRIPEVLAPEPGADIAANNSADVRLKNTIVSHAGGQGPSCDAAVHSEGYNLEDGTSCGLERPSDKASTDPLLSALADNGGQTDTHAPAGTSPAIGGGDPDACPAVDQREAPRPTPPGCEIGAVEVGAVSPADPDADGSDANDNCPATANPGQGDADGDGTGDACDPTPRGPVDPDDATPPKRGSDSVTTIPDYFVISRDTSPALVALKLRRQRLRLVRRRGYAFRFTTSERGDAKVALIARPPRRRRAVVVGRSSRTAPAYGTFSARTKFSRRAKKLLRRSRKVRMRVRVTFTDAAGNRTVASRRVTLR